MYSGLRRTAASAPMHPTISLHHGARRLDDEQLQQLLQEEMFKLQEQLELQLKQPAQLVLLEELLTQSDELGDKGRDVSQRGRGEHLFWIHTQSPPPDFGLSD